MRLVVRPVMTVSGIPDAPMVSPTRSNAPMWRSDDHDPLAGRARAVRKISRSLATLGTCATTRALVDNAQAQQFREIVCGQTEHAFRNQFELRARDVWPQHLPDVGHDVVTIVRSAANPDRPDDIDHDVPDRAAESGRPGAQRHCQPHCDFLPLDLAGLPPEALAGTADGALHAFHRAHVARKETLRFLGGGGD